MRSLRVVVIGAGAGGLATAADLGSRGMDVTVLERAGMPGGKIRQVAIDGRHIDVGPTVFTMRWVLDELFAQCGASLEDLLTLKPADVLARHAWAEGGRLDLFSDVERSADAVGALCGAAEARRFSAFCLQARRTYDTLDRTFIHAAKPNPLGLTGHIGRNGIKGLLDIKPFTTLWGELSRQFHDPRLRQLFGRYATYCGSSPYQAPATLMLIAHAERKGVWLVEGGMHRIARALERLAERSGVKLRYGADVSEVLLDSGRVAGVRLAGGETIAADVVVVNADAAAIAAGLLGQRIDKAVPPTPPRARSLSAVTWATVAKTSGFTLSHHNVFFSADYAAEFNDLGRSRLPGEPTVYICAQDRGANAATGPAGAERLLLIVNAPPCGDERSFSKSEIDQCEHRVRNLLNRCGLEISSQPQSTVVTTPADFERLFPGTGGSIYGRSTHGSMASFRRPGARTRVPGLYLTGGSAHPGAGVPMAVLSGRLAAASVISDLASTSRSQRVATAGGTSTRSATTGSRVLP